MQTNISLRNNSRICLAFTDIRVRLYNQLPSFNYILHCGCKMRYKIISTILITQHECHLLPFLK